jgi:hypothetical protein
MENGWAMEEIDTMFLDTGRSGLLCRRLIKDTYGFLGTTRDDLQRMDAHADGYLDTGRRDD